MLFSPLLKWALGGTLFLSLMLGGALFMEKRQNTKLKAQVQSLNAQLRAVSTTQNNQRVATERTITETKIIYRDAEKVAERIEKAPTASDCKTPGEILGADL